MPDERSSLADVLRRQAHYCSLLGSPLYARLLERAGDDVVSGGPVWRVLRDHLFDPAGSALALRFMGAIHRLVLEGRAPELATFYPSAGGSAGRSDAVSLAFIETVDRHVEVLRALVERPVQTNEVGRAAALIGGFLTVADRTGLPLRILEIGASAGLLLRWDRYRYEERGATWGPADSPVRLCDYNSETRLPFDVSARVAERLGCDRDPLDPADERDRLTLLSYVWPDQVARLRNLRAALELARAHPAPVERATAGEWLRRVLRSASSGVATVVYQSIVLQYLPTNERDEVAATIAASGAAATPGAPVAWLRMEPAGDVAHVHLTLWPDGDDRLVAVSGYHGTGVRWLGYV